MKGCSQPRRATRLMFPTPSAKNSCSSVLGSSRQDPSRVLRTCFNAPYGTFSLAFRLSPLARSSALFDAANSCKYLSPTRGWPRMMMPGSAPSTPACREPAASSQAGEVISGGHSDPVLQLALPTSEGPAPMCRRIPLGLAR